MPETDETTKRHHPSYVLIWGFLVAALALSILIGEAGIPIATVVLIFSIAIVKAYLVMAYFMHIRFEPLFVTLILASGALCLYVLFFGLVPDIVYGTTS